MTLRLVRSFGWIMPLASLAGCADATPEVRPALPGDNAYAVPLAAKGPATDLGVAAPTRWWDGFGSPQLSALVDRALAGNRDLAASLATLERARAQARAAAGKLYPQVDANAGIERQRFNLSAFGIDPASFGLPGGAGTNPEATLYSVGGGISYDLDLFGANRIARDKALADAEAQLHETEAAHLTIAGRVVLQALTIAALNDRIDTANALVADDLALLGLAEKKRRAGAGTKVEVLAAEAQLAADRAVLPQLEQQRAEARNMLAVLLGIAPAALEPTAFSLADLKLPVTVPVALPSQLVHRRPDILASEARLNAAAANVGIAAARLYPSVMLGATFEQMTSKPENLLTSGANGFNLFANLAATLFDGGRRKAEKKGAEADLQAAAARYQQTVLTAFGQVSDLLSALNNDAKAARLQVESASVAEQSKALAGRSFRLGGRTMIAVLDASRQAHRARLMLLDARGRQLVNVARLYVASAGGWTGAALNAPAAE